MNELLTTRELQRLLKVDRITIYRMLEQGRLPGFKMGGQWRFSRREIEEWLEVQRDSPSLLEDTSELPLAPSGSALPLHCVQNMQDVFAEALDVAAVMTDLTGKPLTPLSHSREFCNLILATDEGRQRCARSWSPVNEPPGASPQFRPCHAGLLCASVVVWVGGEPVAGFACCQFGAAGPGHASPDWAGLGPLADELGVDANSLRAAARGMPAMSDVEMSRMSRLLKRMSMTFSEIGQERLALLSRLQSIAEMTKV